MSMPRMPVSAAKIESDKNNPASGTSDASFFIAVSIILLRRVAAQARQIVGSQHALVAPAVDDPRGVSLNLHRVANRRLRRARPVGAAFDVRQPFGRRAEQPLLLLAMRAPRRAVKFRVDRS